MTRFVFLALAAMAMASIASAAPSVVPGRYIVQVKDTAAPGKVIAKHAVAPDFVYKSAVKGFAASIPPGKLKALESDPDVVSIVPDRVVKAIGTVSARTKPPKNPVVAQVIPAGIARIGASPAQSAFTGAGVGVAVVDTGIDLANADLPVAPATSSYTAYGSSAQDDEGHGTHVSGIIAARNNDIGVVGVAPGATLYAVKVLDAQGYGTDATIMAGLDWVSANAASVSPAIRVVNMSLGRDGSLDDNPQLRSCIQALHQAGIVVVVAAGNDGSLEVSQQVPSTYPEVLAIASTTAKAGTSKYRYYPAGIGADTASFFTTDGAFSESTGIGVTVSAPGEDQEDISRAGAISSVGILSTKLGGGTTRMSGTSMASPHVCGVVARFFEASPATTDVEAVRGLIRANAGSVGTAPLDSPTSSYSFDGQREGVVLVPELW